ncbi:hypothetical protein, partial [Lactobacillus crispatus]|uniref:hypothetical protein n=1 Tax=Lactobacillus crispatus TaxID=47770 RepID=UPI001C5E40B0
IYGPIFTNLFFVSLSKPDIIGTAHIISLCKVKTPLPKNLKKWGLFLSFEYSLQAGNFILSSLKT